MLSQIEMILLDAKEGNISANAAMRQMRDWAQIQIEMSGERLTQSQYDAIRAYNASGYFNEIGKKAVESGLMTYDDAKSTVAQLSRAFVINQRRLSGELEQEHGTVPKKSSTLYSILQTDIPISRKVMQIASYLECAHYNDMPLDNLANERKAADELFKNTTSAHVEEDGLNVNDVRMVFTGLKRYLDNRVDGLAKQRIAYEAESKTVSLMDAMKKSIVPLKQYFGGFFGSIRQKLSFTPVYAR